VRICDPVTGRRAQKKWNCETRKCARPDINKGMTEVQKPCVERIKEFWQEILPAVYYEAWPEDIFLATLCSYMSDTIRQLIRGDVQRAKEILWRAEHLLVCSKAAAEEPEILHQSLHILDIGWFAWSLAAYSRFGWAMMGNVQCFCDILEVAKEIWYAREIFAPHLSDALKAANIFIRDRKYVSAGRAFRYALKALDFMHADGKYYFLHPNKPIRHLLNSSAISKLKEILREYDCRRGKDAGLSE